MSSAAVEQDTRPVAAQPAPQDLYRLLMLRKERVGTPRCQ